MAIVFRLSFITSAFVSILSSSTAVSCSAGPRAVAALLAEARAVLRSPPRCAPMHLAVVLLPTLVSPLSLVSLVLPWPRHPPLSTSFCRARGCLNPLARSDVVSRRGGSRAAAARVPRLAPSISFPLFLRALSLSLSLFFSLSPFLSAEGFGTTRHCLLSPADPLSPPRTLFLPPVAPHPLSLSSALACLSSSSPSCARFLPRLARPLTRATSPALPSPRAPPLRRSSARNVRRSRSTSATASASQAARHPMAVAPPAG